MYKTGDSSLYEKERESNSKYYWLQIFNESVHLCKAYRRRFSSVHLNRLNDCSNRTEADKTQSKRNCCDTSS